MKIVAEAGTSHGGSLDKAKQLIYEAKNAGADCIKFQWVYADEILHPNTGFVSLPTGNIPLYDKFKELEVNPDFFSKLRDYSKEIDIEFMCSPFGIKSLDELLRIHPDYIKIASPELNHTQLLQHLSLNNTDNIPVVLSSGVSKLSDIEKALSFFDLTKNKITLLHCITSYPAPENEYNLSLISELSTLFGLPCGVSDHSLSPFIIPLISLYTGSTMLEKHITLDNNGNELDDPVALSMTNFTLMCKEIRNAEKLESIDLFDYINEKFGKEQVIASLGNGIKRLAPSEKNNYTRTNRSLRFIRDLKKGSYITQKDIAILRTEKILEVGLSPEFYDLFIGAKLITDVKNGDAVKWSCVIEK